MIKLAAILVFALIVTPLSTVAQNEDYIVIDSIYRQGRTLSIGKDKVQFKRSKKDTPVFYSVEEVREYGSNNKIYESISIKGERHYYQRIATGEVSMYKTKKSYFIVVNDSISFLTKKNFRSVLFDNINCIDNEMYRVSYSRPSLENFGNVYNSKGCNVSDLPFFKYGFIGSYNSIRLTFLRGSESGSKYNNFNDTNSFSFGVFSDIPLFRPKSLFITTELSFISLNTSLFLESVNYVSYLKTDINGLIAPIGIKWVMSDGVVKPYLKGGGLAAYLKMNFPDGVIDANINVDDEMVELSTSEIENSSGVMGGFYAGLGTEFRYRNRTTFHLDVKYEKAFNGVFNDSEANFNGIFIGLGISF